MIPSRVLLKMASSEPSTMAASNDCKGPVSRLNRGCSCAGPTCSAEFGRFSASNSRTFSSSFSGPSVLGRKKSALSNPSGILVVPDKTNDRNTRFQPLNLSCHLGAGGASHEMVGHHQVDVASLKQLNTVVRRGCGNHPVALPFKNQFAKVQSWRFIINAKNCRPERVCGHPFLPGVQKLSQPEVK